MCLCACLEFYCQLVPWDDTVNITQFGVCLYIQTSLSCTLQEGVFVFFCTAVCPPGEDRLCQNCGRFRPWSYWFVCSCLTFYCLHNQNALRSSKPFGLELGKGKFVGFFLIICVNHFIICMLIMSKELILRWYVAVSRDAVSCFFSPLF